MSRGLDSTQQDQCFLQNQNGGGDVREGLGDAVCVSGPFCNYHLTWSSKQRDGGGDKRNDGEVLPHAVCKPWGGARAWGGMHLEVMCLEVMCWVHCVFRSAFLGIDNII